MSPSGNLYLLALHIKVDDGELISLEAISSLQCAGTPAIKAV